MRKYLLHWMVLLIAGWINCLAMPKAHSAERYYLVMFAYDGRLKLPRSSHTFATFIKVEEKPGVDREQAPMDLHTISWMAAAAPTGQLLLRPAEQGVNFDLLATLKTAAAQNARVTAWGPFEIKKELYDRAVAQIDRLNSGEIAYKALDGRFRPDSASNCIHAVSDIVDGPLLDTGTAYGESASWLVLRHLAPSMIAPRNIHRDLLKRIDWGGNSVTFRNDVPGIAGAKE